MIKIALHAYKKNIWEVFSIIGIVAIALFAGLGIAIPAISNSLKSTYDNVVKTVQDVVKQWGGDFKPDIFLKSLTEQFKALDWANPIQTLTNLFQNDNLLKIVGTALEAAGVKGAVLAWSIASIKDSIDALAKDISSQVWTVAISIGIGALVSFILAKIVIRFRATRYHHPGWFILSLVINIASLALAYFLIYLIFTGISNKVGLVFALLGVGLLMYILTFANAILCYKPKEVKVKDILNFKNLLFLFLANLIMLAISLVVVVIVGIFSDIIALLIAIPAVLIVSIITECVIISYTEQVTMYYILKSGKPMPKEYIKKDNQLLFLQRLVEKEKLKPVDKKKK